MIVPDEDDDTDLPDSIDTPSIASTVRPTPTRLPTSLRGLFDDDITPSDILKPLLPPPSATTTPMAAPPVVPVASSPAREFVGMTKAGLREGVDDVQLAKYNEFSFPSHQPRYSQDTIPSLPPPRLPPTSPSPVTGVRSANEADVDSSPADSPPSRGRKPSLIRQVSVAVPVESTLGPPIQPLDFVSLTESQEATNSYLARTVDDLTRWFSVIEVGFATMLEQSGGNAIAEEQEETPTEQASFSAISNADSNVHVQPRRALPAELH